MSLACCGRYHGIQGAVYLYYISKQTIWDNVVILYNWEAKCHLNHSDKIKVIYWWIESISLCGYPLEEAKYHSKSWKHIYFAAHNICVIKLGLVATRRTLTDIRYLVLTVNICVSWRNWNWNYRKDELKVFITLKTSSKQLFLRRSENHNR